MEFKILAKDGKARRGELHFKRGIVRTPAFMPVGTLGTVKGIRPEQVEELGADILLGNTFHLWLRPGTDVIKLHGDLHDFMHWNKPILTDSGGFQVFSLSGIRKVTEEGVKFQHPINGSRLFLSPEISMQVQHALGSDIVMQFDECIGLPADYRRMENAMELSLRWARRCKDEFLRLENPNSLFGIIQGGTDEGLRERSLEGLTNIGFDGYAIGGLAVGEPKDVMYKALGHIAPIMPEDKPRYLMGVGTPINILEAIERGVDMFDCIMPTRNGRNGQLFTRFGTINMRNKKWENDFSPIDPDAHCAIDTRYSKAYLHHLIKAGEMLGLQLASIHNLAFYLWLVKEARRHIVAGDFTTWKSGMVRQLSNRL